MTGSPEMEKTYHKLHDRFSTQTIARFGVIDCVVTDNGTQFTSNEFKQFCDTYKVKHICNTIQGQMVRRRGLWTP